MPPVVVAAGITAAGALGGAALASRATNKSTSAQAKANQDTLAYTRQKDTLARQEALRREALWQAQQNQWRNAANQALSNWGFQGSLSPISGYGPATPMGSPGMQQAVPRAAQGRPRPSPYADEVQPEDGYQNSAWNDWRRYGLE